MKTTLRPILIVGFGSIGRRHLRNLKQLGYTNFVLYRTGKSSLPTSEIADIPVESTLTKAFAHKPFATIIANPTALHIPIALAAARTGSHIFLEKPISHNMKGVEELHSLAKSKNIIFQVGFQFRFHPDILRLKKLVESGEMGNVISIQSHWGEYLPDWHPWEDYRKSYSARKELGGGVLLTLCHPFDYLRFLFGDVTSVEASTSQQGSLNIDVETCADVVLNFTSGIIGNIHLDYLQKPPQHFLHIVTEKDEEKINLSSKSIDRNEMFLNEMTHFLSCIIGNKQPVCTLDDGIQTLKIILAAKKSVRDKRLINLL